MSAALDQLLHQMAHLDEIAWNEETYDLGLARSLAADDRATFIGKLMETSLRGDTHAILTLAHMGAMEALPMLQAAAKSGDPWAQTARRALVILGHGAEVVQEVANDAVHGRAKMGRVAAVLDLPKIGGPIAIAALEDALADPEDAVRMLAWEGLVDVFDLRKLIRSPEGKAEMSTDLELQQALLSSDLPAFVRIGIAGMRALVEKLQAGATPQSLGIAWAPDPNPELFQTLRLALFDTDATFPVDEIAKLKGTPRQIAEMMIAMRLESADPRVPEALTRLDAAWTVPALEEVASAIATPPDLRRALLLAVRALEAS